MRYKIRENFWSFGNDFEILDHNDTPKFIVDGAAFSWGDKLSFQDTEGGELAFINQKMFSWKPKYEIYKNGECFAEVVKEFSWFNKEFTLDVPGPNDYSIIGSFWLHEYNFMRSGQLVARVSKKMWSWTDAYGIDIVDGEDDIAILCSAIVIDQVLHDEKK